MGCGTIKVQDNPKDNVSNHRNNYEISLKMNDRRKNKIYPNMFFQIEDLKNKETKIVVWIDENNIKESRIFRFIF